VNSPLLVLPPTTSVNNDVPSSVPKSLPPALKRKKVWPQTYQKYPTICPPLGYNTYYIFLYLYIYLPIYLTSQHQREEQGLFFSAFCSVSIVLQHSLWTYFAGKPLPKMHVFSLKDVVEDRKKNKIKQKPH